MKKFVIYDYLLLRFCCGKKSGDFFVAKNFLLMVVNFIHFSLRKTVKINDVYFFADFFLCVLFFFRCFFFRCFFILSKSSQNPQPEISTS